LKETTGVAAVNGVDFFRNIVKNHVLCVSKMIL